MTTLVLQAAGSALGSAVGGPIGAAVGRVAGALAGSALDGALFGTGEGTRVTQGPRLSEMEGLGSTEGAPIPRVYGRARVGGQLIWATRFEEVASTSVERSGRSGGKSLGSGGKTVTTTYAYFANLAVGLCEGPIALVRRVWADGRELDLTTLTMRLHRGALDQAPDPLIVAKEGAENAPAYGGLAYIVFERLPLAGFGNRVPQFSFEVVRPVGSLAEAVRAVCLIPGAGEFAYDTKPVSRLLGLGASAPENVHQLQRDTDMAASLDALQALCPNVAQVSLVVSWFGDDLRAGHCTVAPGVDRLDKVTLPEAWSAAGLARAEARLVSYVEGAAAYGGTPSDASVLRAIQDLKARSLAVVLYPFVMMDVPQANDLPDPWSGVPGQPPYPWRGRITCDPAPGRPGSPDGTAAAAAQVAAFFGTAAPGDFAVSGTSVTYSGPAEWSYRRLVLHMAHLAKASGGVDGFVIGSELVGLTRVRGASGAYPAVAALAALAADLRTVLGPETKLTYAADWTEYGAHVRDGGDSLTFPLDPLWAHPAIDAVGIDFYPPLSDWRDGPNHLDRAEARGPADPAYLRRGVAAGEAFDWYYAGPADRLAQGRAPITDGAYGQVFAYRAKDLKGWWGDGGAWTEAWRIDRASGAVSFPAGAVVPASLRNRVLNGGFMINQRSYASGAALAANAYGFDRWKAGPSGCTLTFAAGTPDVTVTITAGSLRQIVEAREVEGGAYTLSWTGSAQGRVNGAAYAASPIRLAALPANTAVTVEFTAGTLARVQFEPGRVVTPFERRGALKLALCQRYFAAVGYTHAFVAGAAGVVNHAGRPLPVPMRATPTVTRAATSSTNGTLASTAFGPDFLRSTLTATASGLSEWTGTLSCDAEL